MTRTTPRRRAVAVATAAGAAAATLVLSACAGTDTRSTAEAPRTVAEPVVLTYDGGLYVLDGNSLAVARDLPLPGFLRVNPAGDDRHVVVTTPAGFRVLDAARPELTGKEFPAAEPGHVVHHGTRTTLFADGSGQATTFDTAALGDGDGLPDSTVRTAAAAHHGVAVELGDGRTVMSVGTEEARTGATVLDREGRELARNEQCPGVHGEAVAARETVVLGCQTGALVYRDGTFTKIDSPAGYGRIGTQAGSDGSPVTLGDYKTDKDAELERPTRVSLVDTDAKTIRLVELGTSYTFRSFGRTERGEGVVLGTDGQLHLLDTAAGTVTRRIPVLAPWQEPLRWQQARPAVFVRGVAAYVSDPATAQVHRIDLTTGARTASVTLPAAPNEISGVAG